jgi:hypothetical protein
MTTKPTLTIAALAELDGAAASSPFTFGIKNHVVTFPDPLDLDAVETEQFMRDVEGLSYPMEIFKRWLSDEDYAVIVASHLTGRQAAVLMQQVRKHYEAFIGDAGEGAPSSAA